MPDSVGKIADAVRRGQDPGARLRISKVTAVDAVAQKAQLGITDTAWVTYDIGLALQVGDRIYAFQQGSTVVIAGKITGATGPPVGSVTMYAGLATTVPNGWLLAQGQAVSRADFPVLFTRLGTVYGGGDGATTFNLPNLVDRVAVGTSGTRVRGSRGGAATVALTTGQLPAHDHGAVAAHSHTVAGGTNDKVVASGTGATVGDELNGSTGAAGGHTHASVGAGEAHENMPPYVSMHYIVRVV